VDGFAGSSSRFYSALALSPYLLSFFFFFLFSFAFPNTVGDNRVIPRARLKGEGTVKWCYTRPHVCVQWKPEDRSESTHAPRAALSLHGLLIPNFADNGRGASFSPFYADTLVERRTNARRGWILRARRDLARPSFFSSPPFSLLVLLFLSFLFRSRSSSLSLSLSLSL